MRPFLAALVVATGWLAVRSVLQAGDRRAAGFGGPWSPPQLPAPAWVERRVRDGALPLDAARAWTAWLGALVAGSVAAGGVGGVGLSAVTAFGLVGAPAVLLAATAGRAARLVDAALPEALDALARHLRSGATLPAALAEVPAFAGVASCVTAGATLREAIADWVRATATPGARVAGAALALAAEAGGSAAAAVDGVAATLRAELAVVAEVRAQSSQARLSAFVMAVAPVVFGALAAGTDRRTARFLLRTPIGSACLAAALALDAIGAWWMHKVTAVDA